MGPKTDLPWAAQAARTLFASHAPGPLVYAASNIYHNLYWYPFIGAKRAEAMLNTPWGQKFLAYSEGLPFNPGAASKTRFTALAGGTAALFAAIGLGAYLASKRD